MNNESEILLKKVTWGIFSTTIILVIFLIFIKTFEYFLKLPFSSWLYFSLLFWIGSLIGFFYYVKGKKDIVSINRAHLRFFILHVVMLTIAVHYLGGIESFGAMLYVLLIIYAVFLLPEKHRFIVMLACVLSFSGLVFLEYYGVIPHQIVSRPTGVYKDIKQVSVRLITALSIFIFSILVSNRYSNTIERQSINLLEIQNELKIVNRNLRKKVKELELAEVGLSEAKETLEIKVTARVQELEELTQGLEKKVKKRTKELEQKIVEMEKFQKFAVGREIKMIELKKKIKELKKRNNKNY